VSRAVGRGLAALIGYALLAPAFAFYAAGLMSFETVARSLSLVPGLGGMWLRRLWYRRTLAACGDNLYVDFLAAIRTPKTRVGHHVHVGVECWIGWADIGDDVMLGGHIVVLSGLTQHAFERLDVPMRRQPGAVRCIHVGRDVWVGNGAIIGADVSEGTVVAAGSVVTRTFPPLSILAGVPARLVGNRRDPVAADAASE
jgi:acetyltransferase-like isoleucine patch superfamily enzyme